jgi:hypothetical protein
MNIIMKKKIFWETEACTYTIEFQKRGLPHARILIWLSDDYKIDSPETIDTVVLPSLPTELEDNELHQLVERHMLHRECTPSRPCWNHALNKCRFNFPKPFSDATITSDEEIRYKRSSSDDRNSRVASYNPYLLKRYRCHIHVEVCHENLPIKHLFKSVYKGVDTGVVEGTRTNEVEAFLTE